MYGKVKGVKELCNARAVLHHSAGLTVPDKLPAAADEVIE
jgi:hypothetical protein